MSMRTRRPGALFPVMVTYLHEDTDVHPGDAGRPGRAPYRYVSPSEGDVVARRFYEKNYNVFVLAYTVNYFDEPLRMQPLNDISRAVRIIRTHCGKAAYRSEKAGCVRIFGRRTPVREPLRALQRYQ